MTSSKIKNIGFFILCFGLGLSFFYSISENISIQRGLTDEQTRDPAAIEGKIFQITSLSSEQIKTQLQKKIEITPTIDGKKTILFSGFSSALCKNYFAIEIEFTAEGVAVAGEPPVMKIVAPCTAAQNPAEIAAINLPIEKILNQKTRNAEYSFDGFNAVVTFSNSADEWPRQWILKRVEFKNAAGENKSANFSRAPASVSSKNISTDRLIVLEF